MMTYLYLCLFAGRVLWRNANIIMRPHLSLGALAHAMHFHEHSPTHPGRMDPEKLILPCGDLCVCACVRVSMWMCVRVHAPSPGTHAPSLTRVSLANEIS